MRLLEEKDREEYKKFLESHERCNFQQSLEWGNVKTTWKKEVILSEDKNNKIVGSICVWIRKIPIFGNIMYSARGPVCDIHDENVLKDLEEKGYEPLVYRMFNFTSNYRAQINFTFEAMDAAKVALGRIREG